MLVKKSIVFTESEVNELILRKASVLLGERQEDLEIKPKIDRSAAVEIRYTTDETPRD